MRTTKDPDFKLILFGIGLSLLAFFSNIWLVGALALISIYLYASWKRVEVLLVPLAFFVFIDFAIKTYPLGIGGWWDELFLIVLFSFLFIHKVRLQAFSFKTSHIIYPVVLFVVLGFLSTLISPHITLAQGIEGIRAVTQCFLFLLVILNAPISKKATRGLLLIILVAGSITAGYGIYQYITGVPNPPHWLDRDLEVGLSRAFSFLGSPNAFAGYGILLAPIALGFLFRKDTPFSHKLIFGIIFLILAAGVFSSLTRAAWVAMVPALMLFGILIKKTQWMLGFLVVLLVLASFSAPVRTRFANLFTEQYQEKSEIGGRNYRWNLAIAIFEENPLLGRGPGSYGGAVAYRAQAFQGLYVDNFYLQILSNFGFLGFMAFLWILIEIFRYLIFSAKKALERDRIIIYGALCGVVAFLTHNVTENLIEVIPLAVIFWAIIGLAGQLSTSEREL